MPSLLREDVVIFNDNESFIEFEYVDACSECRDNGHSKEIFEVYVSPVRCIEECYDAEIDADAEILQGLACLTRLEVSAEEIEAAERVRLSKQRRKKKIIKELKKASQQSISGPPVFDNWVETIRKAREFLPYRRRSEEEFLSSSDGGSLVTSSSGIVMNESMRSEMGAELEVMAVNKSSRQRFLEIPSNVDDGG